MFLRLLWESFVRQRRRKLLAGAAILLGTTAVTAMLALATTIGDRIHRELAVYGANIIVYPKADQLDVKVGGVDVRPATGGATLKESDLDKLQAIFWANNITGISPELKINFGDISTRSGVSLQHVQALGLWFDHSFGTHRPNTGADSLHPSWKLSGHWPNSSDQIVLGDKLAARLKTGIGDAIFIVAADNAASEGHPLTVTGVVNTATESDDLAFLSLASAQLYSNQANAVSRVEISARTKPEDAFARLDPDTLSPKLHDRWYCSPYANSISYQIREAIPGSQADQVRRVEQTEGTVLARISGLMWLVSGAALLAAGFAVSAAMATAVLERRGEIGLMRSLGASKAGIAALFYAELALLAIIAGTFGYLAGSALAFWLGARIFPGDGAPPLLNFVLLPVILAMALIVAIAGSTPSIRRALNMDPSTILRADA